MKKIFVALTISMACLVFAFTQNASSTKRMIEVAITIGNQKFDAEIEENSDTAQILERLPIELSMYNLKGSNLVWGGSFVPAKGTFVNNLKKGDIALCEANYFIVFYDDYPSNKTSKFFPIGKITSNLEGLNSLNVGGKLRIEKK
jgi:hypothetical protein